MTRTVNSDSYALVPDEDVLAFPPKLTGCILTRLKRHKKQLDNGAKKCHAFHGRHMLRSAMVIFHCWLLMPPVCSDPDSSVKSLRGILHWGVESASK